VNAASKKLTIQKLIRALKHAGLRDTYSGSHLYIPFAFQGVKLYLLFIPVILRESGGSREKYA